MKHLIVTLLASISLLATHAAEPPAADAAGRWPVAKARQWYDSQPWPCGFNYVPAHAISYTEMWMPYNFDTAKMGKELALAEDIGFNCLRVVLPFVVWEHDPEAFKKRLNAFLEVCDRHGLRVMFALFDDCAFGSDAALKNPRYGKQPDVLAGRSNDVTVCLQNSREATPCRAPLNQGQSAHARRPGQVHERAVNLV